MKKKRGLATLSPERRREIASMGGKAVPTQFKKNDERTREIARRAGIKSGEVRRKKSVDKQSNNVA